VVVVGLGMCVCSWVENVCVRVCVEGLGKGLYVWMGCVCVCGWFGNVCV